MARLDLNKKEEQGDGPKIRLTTDVSLEDSVDLQEWGRQLGARSGKVRIPVAQIMRAMIRRAMTDEEWRETIARDVLDTW